MTRIHRDLSSRDVVGSHRNSNLPTEDADGSASVLGAASNLPSQSDGLCLDAVIPLSQVNTPTNFRSSTVAGPGKRKRRQLHRNGEQEDARSSQDLDPSADELHRLRDENPRLRRKVGDLERKVQDLEHRLEKSNERLGRLVDKLVK
jgi:septal ring factor EnvC (AmiA/AmiB activator)